MKLYEFSYTDHLNQSEGQVLARVAEFLESEERLQGWAEGYTFRQCRSPEQLASGEYRYVFEVIGEYQTGVGDDAESRASSTTSTSSGVAASPTGDATP